MRVGLFDHLELAGDRPLATQFDERLEFAAAADRAGFYCLHVAEHHSSPLNMVPAPGVYLAAVARATRSMRLGPLVYLLTLYTPLKLAEEICMLDHLSRGRLEVGVGRGVSPFELDYHRIDHAESREIFFEAFDCLKTALGGDRFSHRGRYFSYDDVPMPLRPLQDPFPPFWYGSSSAVGASWAGAQGLHFVANGPVAFARKNLDAYRAGLDERGAAAQPKAAFGGGAAVGLLRHVVVAETDADARRIAKPALDHHAGNLHWLRRRHANDPLAARLVVPHGETFEEWDAARMVIAGAPDLVRDELAAQISETGINYLVVYPFFGTMSLADALRSLDLFSSEVMPALGR